MKRLTSVFALLVVGSIFMMHSIPVRAETAVNGNVAVWPWEKAEMLLRGTAGPQNGYSLSCVESKAIINGTVYTAELQQDGNNCIARFKGIEPVGEQTRIQYYVNAKYTRFFSPDIWITTGWQELWRRNIVKNEYVYLGSFPMEHK